MIPTPRGRPNAICARRVELSPRLPNNYCAAGTLIVAAIVSNLGNSNGGYRAGESRGAVALFGHRSHGY